MSIDHDMVHFIQEVTEEQLNSILDKIGECVKRAQSAGVDIIEVHIDIRQTTLFLFLWRTK